MVLSSSFCFTVPVGDLHRGTQDSLGVRPVHGPAHRWSPEWRPSFRLEHQHSAWGDVQEPRETPGGAAHGLRQDVPRMYGHGHEQVLEVPWERKGKGSSIYSDCSNLSIRFNIANMNLNLGLFCYIAPAFSTVRKIHVV